MIPPYVICDTGDHVYLWISGVHNVEQGLGVLVSSSSLMTSLGHGRAGSLFVDVARKVHDQVLRVAPPANRSMTLIGHSYGGCLSEALAVMLFDQVLPSQLRVLTFGSPRPGDSAFAEDVRQANIARYMNSRDPVPRFPPHAREAPLATLSAGLPVALAWNEYVQPLGGLVLFPDGTSAAADLPPLVAPIQDVQLLTWVIGSQGFLSAEHTLKFYRDRLTDLVVRESDPATVVPAQSGSENVGSSVGIADFLAQVAQGVMPSLNPASEGEIVAYIPKTQRATVSKVGSVWLVGWGDAVVWKGHTKANAHAAARNLNRFLSSLQMVQSVYRANLHTALDNYLTAASTAGTGFDPVLNVV